jgi:NAD(P)-dependent dehydrogenase (short-subunit alcohol dehydrogenase family)
MDVNLKGVMLCLKAQLAKISDGGAIVNASSIAGVQGMFFSPPLFLHFTSRLCLPFSF